jgi:hypothetical protein
MVQQLALRVEPAMAVPRRAPRLLGVLKSCA